MSEAWGSGSDTRWRKFRAFILERDHYLCTIQLKGCTVDAPLRGGHVDHIIALSMGGQKYDADNCRASCASCNGAKSNHVQGYEPEPRQMSAW